MNNTKIIKSIKEVVLYYFDVKMEDVKSESRKNPLPFVRQILIVQTLKRTKGITQQEMVGSYGYNSHSMCYHSLVTIDNLKQFDKVTRNQLAEIDERIDEELL